MSPMVPENASHWCARTRTKRVGSWANGCPDKCFDVVMTKEEWNEWVKLMEGQHEFERVWANIVKLDDELLPGWRQSTLIYWSNALAGEAGEVCNATKKMLGGGTKGDPATPDRVKGELVDVATYVILMWVRLGGSVDEFIVELQQKNEVNWARMKARGKVEVKW